MGVAHLVKNVAFNVKHLHYIHAYIYILHTLENWSIVLNLTKCGLGSVGVHVKAKSHHT